LAAGEVIIITTPEPTAITDAYGIIKVIASAEQDKPIWIAVNMVKNEEEGLQVLERLATVSQRFLGIELSRIGFIPSDAIVSKAVKEQQPFVISHPRSAASQSINQIATNLLKGDYVNTGATSFFERLLEKFR
jgi:flagellar biosynthesis protein FlhG